MNHSPQHEDASVLPAPPTASPGEFASFYRSTLFALRGHLARLIGREDARDLAQDAYVRVYKVMNSQQVNHPHALLYTVARRLAFNQLRSRRNAPMSAEEAETSSSACSGAPDTPRIVMARQEWAAVERAIADLSHEHRTVLLLRKTEYLSIKEIAARLELSPSTVEKRLIRAMRLLEEALVDEVPSAASRVQSRKSEEIA